MIVPVTALDWTSIEMVVAGLESDAVAAGSGESGAANVAVRAVEKGVVATCGAAAD